MQIEVGATYVNGWGTKISVVSAPDDKCRWFRDDAGNCYHATGELVQLGGSARANLLELANDIKSEAEK